jgi:hypothetical protein
MARTTVISCMCKLEFENCSEYEALDQMEELIKKTHSIDPKVKLLISEIVTASSEGCGITYDKN